MTEQTESTQPTTPYNEDDTQPIKPIKKGPPWRSMLISILGILILLGLGGFGGYTRGLIIRQSAEDAIIAQQVSEQYSFALVDIEFKHYDAAKQRLEFIIAKDPSFPGASQKLTEVLVLSVIPTPTPAPTLTATPDFSGAESAFARAQQLMLAQDWPGALQALDSIRKLDKNYKTAQVDGMYYFALRNYGYDLITKQGNLEGGIYHLTLAERFGPLDNTAIGLRDGARAYITGASFWELDWEQALTYFTQVSAGWPSLWDGTMTASQRFFIASMRYGDELFLLQEYCAAYDQYQSAAAIGTLETQSANNSNQAYQQCNPATEIPATVPAITVPAITESATTEPTATEAPTATAAP